MKKTKKKFGFNKLVQITGKVLYWAVFVSLVLIAGVIAFPSLNIAGHYKLFTVQSGSMEPTIKTGSIVTVKPLDNYVVGDIITVQDPKSAKNTFTHRIYEIKQDNGLTFYLTKGDANNSPDSDARSKDSVLGKVVFTIPLLGYPVSYAKTREGLIFLIIIPATVIIYSELLAIKNETAKLLEKRRRRKLSLAEKAELEVGEEEIKVERWYHKLLKKIFKKK